MIKIRNNKILSIATRILMTMIGTLIMSISINALYLPYNIMSGGVSGIAIWLNLSFGINTALSIVVINIPIFIVGLRWVNREFIAYSFVGTFFLALFIQLTKGVSFHSGEILTTILLGGVINGLGLGIILSANSSTGGNDIISKILNKYFSYSISTMNFLFNLIIIALSISFFGIDKAVQTLATMYVAAYTTKFILEGVNYKRTVLIITDKDQEVGKAINIELERGCTMIKGQGTYTGEEKSILYAVISVNQVAKLKMLVKAIDPEAFVNVFETRVVFGNGKGFIQIRE